MDTSEGFKFVSRRKRGKRISNAVSRNGEPRNTEETEFDADKLSRLSEAQSELATSEYVNEVFQALVKCQKLLSIHRIEEILCYGLGHFSDHVLRSMMNANLKILRSLISEIRHVAREKKMEDNIMVQYILQQSRIHRETSEVLCKAREELKFLGQTYLNYLQAQRKYEEIRKHYAGRGERSVQETADLVGFKLPHDPK
ncbi:uncharacterized protein LOC105688410 isoform X2 [Athalia rosae]|uniref:uncharacterized protein LOC105688410 isoform X2 n=1 Tax=Athalia rosae TaxID=37344 RepID=UPI002033DAE7|nr:uncharacterized protein LOC105688410 isoform X2 [Athalia rosae]